MTQLITIKDWKEKIKELHPQIKSVEIKNGHSINGTIIINLHFWYKLLFFKSFCLWIVPQINELFYFNKPAGIKVNFKVRIQ